MRLDIIGLAIKREELLTLAAKACADIALELRGVIDVKRARAIKRDEIGDIDQRIDRAKADRLQPVLQPLGRRAVLHAANEAACENRASGRCILREIEFDADGAVEVARNRREIALTQTAKPCGGKIARDAIDAKAIRAVRRDCDFDDGVVLA